MNKEPKFLFHGEKLVLRRCNLGIVVFLRIYRVEVGGAAPSKFWCVSTFGWLRTFDYAFIDVSHSG